MTNRMGHVGRLASQTAAHKLGQILGLLVIPIIVFWLMYFLNAKTDIDGLNREIAGVELAQNSGLTADRNVFGSQDQKSHSSMAEVGNPTELKLTLERRRSDAWRNIILLTLAGAASAMAGIGLAIMMMRSTLLRLDEIETAHKEAQVAKREAEQLALRFSTINTDISNLNTDLATKVKELKSVQDELIKKGRLEQLGQLTATIAHEIRNPLGAIRNSTFLLERKTNSMGAEVSGHLQRINNGVERCDTIISQLLDFSRTKEVNSSLAYLDDWLAKIVREEAQRLPDNIYIECALGLEGLRVPFDAARLQRAVINLLSNASEALAQSDTVASVAGKRHCIWVTTLRNGDFVCIRFADNGPGIAPENIKKIREPLFTTKSFGTGLGIPAVEQIVVQHGGHLDITSEFGEGATFTICIPVQSQQERSAA
jgi:signal transduction histidine kinase